MNITIDTSELSGNLLDNNHFVYENSTSLYGQTRLICRAF